MNHRSSPADIARMDRERDVSSPLRQMTNTQTTQEDGDRTPRATTSGLAGGNKISQAALCVVETDILDQTRLQFDMLQVQVPP